jgi:chromosomal replication initiator protein
MCVRVSGVSLLDSRELTRAWHAVLGRLELELNPRTFDAWLRNTRVQCCVDGRLFIVTEDNLALPWLNERLATVVGRAASAVLGEDLSIEFVGQREDATTPVLVRDEEGEPSLLPGAPWESSLPELVGRVNRRHTLDIYLPARGNRLALESCLALLAGDECAPACIAVWGGPGLGKTHLLHGVALKARAAGWAVACLNAEDFTNRYQGALRAGEASDLQERLRGVRLLIIDDLQYLVGKHRTQDELVHTIDAVCDEGGHVLVAGELHPLQLDLPERLTSRLSAGVVARIEPLDMAERRAFVECLARRLRAALPAWAIDRIAALGDVPVRLVQGAVHCAVALQRCAMLDAGRLDMELSRLALSEFSPAAATPDQVLEAVAAYYGTTASDLRGRSRKPALASARAVVAATLHDRGKSLSEIAEFLDRRDRSTMSPVVTRGRRILESDPMLRTRLAG